MSRNFNVGVENLQPLQVIPHNIPNPIEAALIKRYKGENTPIIGSFLAANIIKGSDIVQKDMAIMIKRYTPFGKTTAKGIAVMKRSRKRICNFNVCGV